VSPTSREAVRLWIQERISEFPDDFQGHWEYDHGDVWVRVERHTEFVSITQVIPVGLDCTQFLDHAWIDQSPQDVLVLSELYSGVNLSLPDKYDAISEMRDGTVTTAARFAPDQDGLSAWWVSFSRNPGEESAGRFLQMILEIETYRTLAVMGMDRIRAIHPVLQRIANELPSTEMDESNHLHMMATLSTLSEQESELHQIWERLAWRVGANRAYHDLVFERLVQLRAHGRDESVGIRHFLKRRLTPAIATADTVMRRRAELTNQIDERAQLLRTQLQLNLQSQTRDLLASLDQSAVRQTRLQSAVEGLSTVAIAYYAVGLISPMIEPFVDPVMKDWVKAGVAPVVIGLVWWTLSRIRNRVSHNA
jgi:uncharacterized membrane-anchored protein